MKKHKYFFITSLAVITALLCSILLLPSKKGYADFGDFSGDSDFGGSDYGSSYDYSGYEYDSNYSSTSGASIDFIIAIIIIAIFIIANNKKPKKIQTITVNNINNTNPNFTSFKEIDPNFSEDELKSKISNLYIQFQQAWEKKDLSTLRPYLTDIAYAQYDRQLNNYRNTNQTNKIDHPTVLSVSLTGWKQENGKDIIVAHLNTRIIDYVISDETNEVVRGSKTAEKFMEYDWILERSSGVKTMTTDKPTAQRCPNCGGEININQSAKCPYCRRIVTTDKFTWLVKEIKATSQKTA